MKLFAKNTAKRIGARLASGPRARYLMALDFLSICLATTLAFGFRYEAIIRIRPYILRNWHFFLIAGFCRLSLYHLLGLYRRVWRYASRKDLLAMLSAGGLGSIAIYVINFLILPKFGFYYMASHSVWLLEGLLSVLFQGSFRFLLRLVQEHRALRHKLASGDSNNAKRRVLIAGAGEAGAMVAREVQGNPALSMEVVGYVDDDPLKWTMRVRDLPVLGPRTSLESLAPVYAIDEVLIAMPTAPGKVIREIVTSCRHAGLAYKTVPGIFEILSGSVSATQLREVQLEDLLRRNPVRCDLASIGRHLADKVVLVTGAGGSIGSELSRQIATYKPYELILLDHSEGNLYQIDLELCKAFPSLNIRPVIADIRDNERIDNLFARVCPNVVFHAAAYKHVPMMESNPREAVTTNVFGTRGLISAAASAGVDRFVLISTDKAVNPTCVMGASKRMAELLVMAAAEQDEGSFMAVRFGNVLGSSGSVVPLFQRQIASGGPITITHPEMQRFFMTIPEAVQLVIQAAALGHGGGIYVLDMGEQVNITELAHSLVELSGLKVGRDIEIVYTGMRAGEKLSEELFTEDERLLPTAHESISVIQSNSIDGVQLNACLADLEEAVHTMDDDTIRAAIRALVPAYWEMEQII
jgi:FlaA1/EpsC-like NDP-sugar epimerase